MRICYVLLSPTFGMHQYTADLANRMVRDGLDPEALAPHDVHLVTTDNFPRDRYAPTITFHTPLTTRNTGFSVDGLRFRAVRDLQRLVISLRPDLVHITGPHIWNVPLMRALTAAHIPVIHTLHDLDPHVGTRFGFLLKSWNQMVVNSADHILVHGQIYRERLLAAGLARDRVTFTPLLHLFLGPSAGQSAPKVDEDVRYEPWALFFARLERYKGVGDLLAACDMLGDPGTGLPRAVVAGRGDISDLWAGNLPKGVELRNRLIPDAEAVDLFRRCGLLVLPYINATQSALIAAAYYFRKPVLVTRTGALPEYVEDGRTGCVVEPGHPATLARCLAEMLGDPAGLARMGAEGRAWYDSRRTVEGQTLVAMYRRVAGAYRGETAPRDR
jgi:glycosyltransferase involved in cell wall biosynthesis